MSEIEKFKPYPEFVGLNGKEVKYLINLIRNSDFKPEDISPIRVEASMIEEIYGGPARYGEDLGAFTLDLHFINHMKKYFDGEKETYSSNHLLAVAEGSGSSATLIGKTFQEIKDLVNQDGSGKP